MMEIYLTEEHQGTVMSDPNCTSTPLQTREVKKRKIHVDYTFLTFLTRIMFAGTGIVLGFSLFKSSELYIIIIITNQDLKRTSVFHARK